MLVLHPKAHVLEHRERVREVDRPAEVEELEAERAGIGPGGPEEVHRERPAGWSAIPRTGFGSGRRRWPGSVPFPHAPAHERLGEVDVPEGSLGAVATPVARAEGRLVPAPERGPRLRAEPLVEHPGKRRSPLGPSARDSPSPVVAMAPSSFRVGACRES